MTSLCTAIYCGFQQQCRHNTNWRRGCRARRGGEGAEDDAGRNRNAVAKCQSPKASVRAVPRRLGWPGLAWPSWSMDNLASDSRRTWCHALGLAWSSWRKDRKGLRKKHQQKQQQQQLQSTTISYCCQNFEVC